VFSAVLNNHGNTHPAQHIKIVIEAKVYFEFIYYLFFVCLYISSTRLIIIMWQYVQIWRNSDIKWLNYLVSNNSGHNFKWKNMAYVKKLLIRAIVKNCQQIGYSHSDTYKMIKLTKDKHPAIRTLVFSCHKQFKNGEYKVTNKKERGWKQKIDGTLVTSIAKALQNDWQYTSRKLSGISYVCFGSIYLVLSKGLTMRHLF
jgi:hypothetical protein